MALLFIFLSRTPRWRIAMLPAPFISPTPDGPLKGPDTELDTLLRSLVNVYTKCKCCTTEWVAIVEGFYRKNSSALNSSYQIFILTKSPF